MSDHITNYEEAVELFYRIPRFNKNHKLQSIERVLTRMGQPDRQMKIVHIAGTNGKGSTSAYLAGLLEKSGCKTGLFTSPHLVDIRERFVIDGKMVSKELFTEAVGAVYSLLETLKREGETYEPCFFDMLFFVGMYIFAKERVEIVVLETGLGGRLDATNAVQQKDLTLITHIALDHTEYLGTTLQEIALEKAGIMRPNIPCIVAPKNDMVRDIFLKKAEELGSKCRVLGERDYACQGVYEKSVAFSYFSSYYGTVPVRLHTPALYQADNVCLALAGFEMLIELGIVRKEQMSVEQLKQTLWETSWAGRMEEVCGNVFLDGAHNTDGMHMFLESVREDDCIGNRTVIFSAVSDKDYKQMLADVIESGLFSKIIVTQLATERGVDVMRLYEEADRKIKNSMAKMECCFMPEISEAVLEVIEKRTSKEYVYIVGSLYLVGQMKQLLEQYRTV